MAGWNDREPDDHLCSYDHLAVWAGAAGLLAPADVPRLRATARHRPGEATAAVDAARRLRAGAYDVLLGGADRDTLARFGQDMRRAAGSLRLTGAPLRREISVDAGLIAPVHAAAWLASELLVSSEHARVRACPGRGCGWLFLDRTGRRRWCTMATCGNRSKAKRFAARHRSV